MIHHRLVARHLKYKDDPVFYQMQAVDAIRWLEAKNVKLDASTRILDLGCGHGVFGAELVKKGCRVTFSDEEFALLPEIKESPYLKFNIDGEDMATLGTYDLVVCSNVYEHLSKPKEFIASAHKMLAPGGQLYLSWTNWLSPWGGHEFSPYHYLGVGRGHLIFDRLTGRKRKHTPYQNLFPTYIGKTLAMIADNKHLETISVAPRYYTELGFLMHIPVVREFLAWNCAMLIRRKS